MPDGSGIWGGAMLPDTLPMLGNGCGDCLCLRFRPDGTVSEVIRWLHEVHVEFLWKQFERGDSFDAALAVAKEILLSCRICDWALKRLEIEAR